MESTAQRCAKETIHKSMRNAIHVTLEVPVMSRLLRIPSDKRILMVGCGGGLALVSLAKLRDSRSIVGLDIDASLLAEAAKRMRDKGIGGELIQADLQAMPFLDRSFDVVVDFGTCYHVARPRQALKEIVRVLDLGGMFVYETPLAQLLAHPFNFAGALPWNAEPSLAPGQTAALWAIRNKR